MMRVLYSSKYSAGAVSTALFLLRVGLGILMLKHGYTKVANFSAMQDKFMNFLHMGTRVSLILVIFSEFFCSILLILGLFTRFASIPLIISSSVALFVATNADFFGKGESLSLYLIGFLAVFIAGPGRASVDGMIGK